MTIQTNNSKMEDFRALVTTYVWYSIFRTQIVSIPKKEKRNILVIWFKFFVKELDIISTTNNLVSHRD